MAEEQDTISLLPDCLLIDIISRLELSTIQMIQTTTSISKRWQHLWSRLPTLAFIDQDDILYRSRKHAFTDYFSFIDKIITQCPTNVNLKKFKLQIEGYKVYNSPGNTARPKSQVNSWIRYAITRNVREVEIRTRDKFSYDDELFFNNSCIMSMKISRCVFKPPNGIISWDKLKCLCIDGGRLDEHAIGISKSPCLETLELNGCYISRRFLKSLLGNFGIERLSCDLETYERFSYAHFNDVDDDDEFADDDDEFVDDYDECMSIKFSPCEFNPSNGAIRWDKLTFLCIDRGELDEDSIREILSRSPCLETLKLKWHRDFRRIDITSKSVKNLELFSFGYKPARESYIDKLEINAPYILSLKITGNMYLEEFLLENVSSLVKADFCDLDSHLFAEDDIEEELLRGLLSSLRHVNDITFGDDNYLGALSRLKDKGFQFLRAGADGDEDRITELIDSGWKNVAAAEEKDAAAEEKKLEKLKLNNILRQPRQKQEKVLEKRESKTQEKLEETGESDDDILVSLFD